VGQPTWDNGCGRQGRARRDERAGLRPAHGRAGAVRGAVWLGSFVPLGQIHPGLGHLQEEKLALGIGQARGDFRAVGGVQPVTGDVFFLACQVCPDFGPGVSFDITSSRELRHRSRANLECDIGFYSSCVFNAARNGEKAPQPLFSWNLPVPIAFVDEAQKIEALS
jgi:hypothetical protein